MRLLPTIGLTTTDTHANGYTRPSPPLPAPTLPQVVEKCDIVYSMLSTPEAAADVFFDPEDGVLAGLQEGKSLVDCATLQVEVSQNVVLLNLMPYSFHCCGGAWFTVFARRWRVATGDSSRAEAMQDWRRAGGASRRSLFRVRVLGTLTYIRRVSARVHV